ncbi:MAG: hypothetical protein MUE42_05650 [Opitutaceae bacterium]|jgi:hypothetical protein|nr:hypothetical protein [Opitutaceae bacterium]
MERSERRDFIRHRLACITPSKKEIAEVLARVEAAEIAHGKAQMARRIAEFEAFAKAHPPGSLKRPPRSNACGE